MIVRFISMHIYKTAYCYYVQFYILLSVVSIHTSNILICSSSINNSCHVYVAIRSNTSVITL